MCRLQPCTKRKNGNPITASSSSNLSTRVSSNTVELNGKLFITDNHRQCYYTSIRESCLAISRCKQPQSRTDISRHHRSRLQKSQLAKFNRIPRLLIYDVLYQVELGLLGNVMRTFNQCPRLLALHGFMNKLTTPR